MKRSGNIDTYEGGFDSFAPISEARKHNTMMDYHGDVENDANGQSLRVVYDAPWFKLISITARRDLECTQTFDMDFTSDDIYRTYQKNEHKQWSQELRLSSHKDTIPLEWLVGAYYFDEETDNSLIYDYRQGFPAWGLSPFKQNQPNSLDTEGHAFFGQATYTLFEKLGLTAGLRYDHEEKDFDGKLYYDQDLSAWGMLPVTREGEKTFEEWLPKFVIDYSCTSDLMNDPEYSWNYELGLKSSWLDNRFIFNTALFYIDWRDQQIMQLLSANDWVIKNAGESHSQGFEVELLARPITGLELTAGFGYTDAKYDDYKDPLAGANYDDKRISNVPEYTYNLAAQYRYASGLFARVDLLGVGNSYYDDVNTQTEDAYEIVNTRLGYEGEYKGFGFDVYVWVKNLFDKEYATRAFDMGGGNWFGRGGDPQTFGITLTGRF
jgi:iron complex outermembrane receptor protein